MIDIVGKRFLGYVAGLVVGFAACQYLDGVSASKYLDFCTILFGAYVAGQTASDSVAFLKGLKTLIK